MDKNVLFPAFKADKSSENRGGVIPHPTTSSHPDPFSEKERILGGMTSGEHLLTLLGIACKCIGELTQDPEFYKEARRRARCRGIAENHKPSMIERWEQLQDEIERTTGNYHLETDTVHKQLFHTMTMSLCKHAEGIGQQLEAQGMKWTREHGWIEIEYTAKTRQQAATAANEPCTSRLT